MTDMRNPALSGPHGQEYRYQRLAKDIARQIRQGGFRAGERLPSLRAMRSKLGLSLGTIHQAYSELEALGLVEARPKSGFFVKGDIAARLTAPRPGRRIMKPRRIKLDAITNQVISASLNPKMVPLGSSALATELLPHKHLGRLIRGITPVHLKRLMRYCIPEGDLELRRILANRLVGLWPGITPDNLIITNGCMEAVSLCVLSFTRPGDVIAVESPTHFGFLQLLRELGRLVVEIPTDPRHGMEPDALEKVLKITPVKACLSIPNFHNPLGSLMEPARREKVAGLLNAHGVPLIEDDIYAELHFDSRRPGLLAGFDCKDLVFTCSSVSKVLASGLRIGWLVAPKPWVERLIRLKAGISMAAGTWQQQVLLSFLASGAYDRYLRDLRKKVQQQLYQTAQALERHFPDSISLALPKGGNMLWVQLPPGVDGVTVYQACLEKGISIVPGAAFSVLKRFRRYIRISCTTPFDARIDQALKTLGRIIHSQAAG
jgi:DNA-binding transcriptional MocR family regulator